MTELILKKRENYNEKDFGYRLLLEDGFNGLYISSSTVFEKRIEVSKEVFSEFKIVANIYQDEKFVCRVTGITKIEDYEGNKTILETLNTGSIFGSLTFSLNSEDINCITKEIWNFRYV